MRHVMGAVCWSYALVLLLAMVVAAPGGAQPSQNDLGTIPPGPEEIENSRPFMPPPRGLGEKAGVLELAGAGTTVENPDGTFTYT